MHIKAFYMPFCLIVVSRILGGGFVFMTHDVQTNPGFLDNFYSRML